MMARGEVSSPHAPAPHIVVVGGGVAGLTLAHARAHHFEPNQGGASVRTLGLIVGPVVLTIARDLWELRAARLPPT